MPAGRVPCRLPISPTRGADRVWGVMLRHGRSAFIGAVCGLLIGVSSASACGGDGPTGPIVNHGVSPGGQQWSQTACMNFRQLVVELSLPETNKANEGGGSAGPPPTARFPLSHVGHGSGVGPAQEGELDGVAFQSVARLVIRFRAGAPITVALRQAPAGDRHRLAFLRPLRFFVVFFPGSRVPTTITALSSTGHVLARLPRWP